MTNKTKHIFISIFISTTNSFDKFNENYIKLPEKIFTSINVHFVIHWERGHMKNTDFGNAVTTTVILHKHKL